MIEVIFSAFVVACGIIATIAFAWVVGLTAERFGISK